MEPIFLETLPQETVWGGPKLKDFFGYADYSDIVGQTWCFASQSNVSNMVQDGPFKHRTLDDLWKNEPHLFISTQSEFPFIIGLLAPQQDLSIQVHPTKEYVSQKKAPDSKNESWFFLEPPTRGKIVCGHDFKSKLELELALNDNSLAKHLDYLSIKRGDYVFVPEGQLHACTAGSVVYEISQRTDITYRVYDYDREDRNGKTRPLHIQQALECIQVPSPKTKTESPISVTQSAGWKIETFDGREYYTLDYLTLDGIWQETAQRYQLATVFRGCGIVNGCLVKKGDNFILPVGCDFTFQGNMNVMLAMEKE